MFGILFGWRKASKCKKLIRHVQCRLKLLKNKRCSIVRQLRDDVAQLLKYGHDQSAFDRVEQLFMDESIVAVYDLLDHFCEFIIIHLSYIRKHKDCPNDINEAVSTLIFASARCGDLPELRVIRKLFEERYGQRFAMVALELLPGNLVNRQIKENLSIKSVADDVKYRLVDEISRSCLLPGPLAIEYYSELQPEQMNKNKGDQVLRSDVQTNCNGNKESQVQAFNIMEAEGKIVHVDLSSDGKKFLIEPCHPHQGSESVGTFTHSSTVLISTPNSMECSMHEKEEGRRGNYTQLNSPFESRIPESSDKKDVGMATESSSESPSQLPKEMIYLDDIEEFKSPTSKDENCQDQRLFLFKSSVILTTDKLEDGFNESCQENNESWNDKEGSRSFRKSRKAYGKRQRRTSVSQESLSVKDVESTIYYGESCANSQNDNHKSHHRRKNQKKIPIDERQKSFCAQARPCSISSNRGMVHECSLEHPCYFCISDDKDDRENQKSRITTLERLPVHNLKEEKVEHSICHCRCFCTGDTKVELELLHQKPRKDYRIAAMMGDNLTYPVHLPNDPTKKLGKAEESDYPQSCASSLCSCSRVISQTQPPYLRALTMPPERPSDCRAENILRSNSFPFQQPSLLSNGSPTCRHVHPKLPDYDQLAATFMALKKANLQHQKA